MASVRVDCSTPSCSATRGAFSEAAVLPALIADRFEDWLREQLRPEP